VISRSDTPPCKWRLTLLTAALGVVLAGCAAPRIWFVFVSSAYSSPVVVRVEYDGLTSDLDIAPFDEVDVIRLPAPPKSASITILNAADCTVIDARELPPVPAIVTFGDPFDSTSFGRLELNDYHDAPGSPMARATDACDASAGREGTSLQASGAPPSAP
jgi:hypothetical protein